MSPDELRALGVQADDGVSVHPTVCFFGAERIRIGQNSRIDAFAVLSAGRSGITIGAHCHFAVGVSLLGAEAIEVEDYAGISAKASIFSSTDTYSGGMSSNPTIADDWRAVRSRPVRIRTLALVGASSVILPGVELGVASSVGALTCVNKSIPDFWIVSGNPPRKIGERDRRILEKLAEFERLRRSSAFHGDENA
jgi:galactoside O-acetyltransferase